VLGLSLAGGPGPGLWSALGLSVSSLWL